MAGAARLEGAEGRELRRSCSLRPGPHRVLDGGGKLLACAGKVTVAPGAQVDRSAVLEAPCYIGPEARVYGGAKIGPGSAIGAGAVVRNAYRIDSKKIKGIIRPD